MNISHLLHHAELEPTDNRVAVLSAVLEAGEAITPQQLLAKMAQAMNKVTLYRILDLLVEHRLIEKHSGAGRAYHYCAGRGHGHFHCTKCDRMLCLNLPNTALGTAAITDDSIASVDSMELRLDGVCAECAGK